MKRVEDYLKYISLVFLGVTVTGCATLKPKASVTSFGAVNIQADNEISAKAQSIADTSDVKVVSGSLPDGLSLQEQSSKLIVLPGYEKKYSIIGSVNGDYMNAMSYFDSLWYPKKGYEDTWRQVLCYPQAPINLVTFGIWGNISPTAWACKRFPPSDEKDRKQALVEALKQGAKAAGGNLVVVTGESTLTVTTMNKYGDHLGTSVSPAMGLQGFILKEN